LLQNRIGEDFNVDIFFTEECGLPRNQAIFKKVYQLIFKEILLEASISLIILPGKIRF